MRRIRTLCAIILALITLCDLLVSGGSATPISHAKIPSNLQRTSNKKGETGTTGGIENARALEKFFKVLADSSSKRRLEPVRIMHFGDSHVAADVLTREIRERFQREFGNSGAGYIVPMNPMSTRRRGVSSGFTEGWVVEGIGGRSSPDGIYGPAGINLATSSPGERAWLETTGNHFEVYFARQAGGGKIEITVDGVDALEEPVILNSQKPRLDSISIDLPDDAPHRLQVRTLGVGRVRLLGIAGEKLTGGVSYDVFGINGARASRLLSWNQQALSTVIRSRAPNLVIVAYGTNEVADAEWTAVSYEALMTEIIERLHSAAPEAAILVFAPPDRGDLPLTKRLVSLVNAQRKAALANNAAFWSAFNAMGGAGSITKWLRQGLAQADRVHLTGAGYARLGDLFYEDVRRAFENSKSSSFR